MTTTTTFTPKTVSTRWLLVDAEGQILGRLASRISNLLRGKHKPQYTPGQNVGDFVVVVNAEKVKVTGRKLEHKEYKWFTNRPSGLKTRTLAQMLQAHPTEVLRRAVKGMMPRTPLRYAQLKRLKIYAGPLHPHGAQPLVEFAGTTNGSN